MTEKKERRLGIEVKKLKEAVVRSKMDSFIQETTGQKGMVHKIEMLKAIYPNHKGIGLSGEVTLDLCMNDSTRELDISSASGYKALVSSTDIQAEKYGAIPSYNSWLSLPYPGDNSRSCLVQTYTFPEATAKDIIIYQKERIFKKISHAFIKAPKR